MHTADASPNQSIGDSSSSNLCTCRDPLLAANAKSPHPRTGNGTRGFNQPLISPFAGTSTPVTETETAKPGTVEIPSWKRVLDVTCILLSLPLWLPVVLLIALWIKIASPGPIFFRQERIGFRGERFMILKFRTMKLNVETQSHERHLEQLISANIPMTKLDGGDPRIIAGGRILRATGLDELPQLFNVFRGEMSLVGPRPCTPHEFKSYQVWQQARVNALPGLTGYWQVNGKNKTTFTEMINMDIFYTKNLTLWLDLTIILRTLPAIMAQVLEARNGARVSVGTTRAANGTDKPVAEQC
jgi:lipopolysaccharide/colanic/teichoic acid biosynthesis glycosyltransferase